jgi:hypothetical protein
MRKQEAQLLGSEELPRQKTSPIFRRHSSSRGTTRGDTPSLKRAASDNVNPYHRAWSTDAHDNSPRENRAHSSRWRPSLYPPPEEERGVGAQVSYLMCSCTFTAAHCEILLAK